MTNQEHRLRITDDTNRRQCTYTCTCGQTFGTIDQPAVHGYMLHRATMIIRAWQTHANKHRPPFEPPAAVTIWIEPLREWRAIPWTIYRRGTFVVYKQLPARPGPIHEFTLTIEEAQIILSPSLTDPLIWR